MSGGTSFAAMLASGLEIAGGAMSIIGAVSGNSSLSRIGTVAAAGGNMADIMGGGGELSKLLNINQTQGVDISTADLSTAAANTSQGATLGNPTGATQPNPMYQGPLTPGGNPGDTGSPVDTAAISGAGVTPPSAPVSSLYQGPLTPSGNPGADSGNWFERAWSGFKGMSPQGQAAAVQAGSGLIGGIANYLAPSPAEKARIGLENAQAGLINTQAGILQGHASQIAAQGGRGNFAPAPAPTPQQTPTVAPPAATTGTQAITPYQVNTAPASPLSVNNNPYATPGLIQGAQTPQYAPV
jgi:hypothetical protein